MGPLAEGIVRGLALPPDYTISEWADAEVILPPELAAEPGRWRTDRAPYQREMMDVCAEDGVEVVCFKTSAQVGKTSILLNVMGYYIAHDPCPMIAVMPDLNMAETFSKSKLAPFLRATTALTRRLAPERSRAASNTLDRKEFEGGFISIAGANSPTALRMQSVRIVFGDEVDAMGQSAGDEGDPLTLAFRRAQTFPNRKLIIASTPKDKGFSRIDDFWERSDKRHLFVPCSCCGHSQILVFEGIVWRKGDPDSAEYRCEGCGSLMSDATLKLQVKKGEWRATAPFTGVVGFHAWQIISPWSSMSEIVAGYEGSKHRADLHKVWVNTVKGETWDVDKAAHTTAELLFARRRDYRRNLIPAGACIVTAGVDVQGDRLEILTVAHGPNGLSWQLEHIVIMLDPTGDAAWKRLEEVLLRRYAHETHPHVSRPIEGVAIDSGYLTQRVYDFAARATFLGRPWYAVKGQDGPGRVAWARSEMRIKGGAKLHIVGIDSIKDEIYSRLANTDPAKDFIFIRKDDDTFGMPWCEQLISERKRQKIDKRGFAKEEWHKPPGTRNEALDLSVYAEAVHRHLAPDHAGRLAALTMDTGPKSTADLARLFQ